jgi:hypothetical protein
MKQRDKELTQFPMLSRSRTLSRGGSHACPEPFDFAQDKLRRRAAGSRAWEPALLQNRDTDA